MARTMSVRSRGGEEHPLLDVLRRLDESGIAALLEARPDLIDPPPHTLPELAARALAPASVETCRHRLDLGARQVLEALCLLPSPTTLGALIEVLAIDDLEAAADLAAILGRLRGLALVAGDGDRLQLLVRPEVPFPAGLGPPVQGGAGIPAGGHAGRPAPTGWASTAEPPRPPPWPTSPRRWPRPAS